MERNDNRLPRPTAGREKTATDGNEIVLFIGNPPGLRTLVEFGASCRIVVIRDLNRALKFMTETNVSRVLVDLGALSPKLARVRVAARPGYDTEVNG